MSISRRPVNDGTGAGFPSQRPSAETPEETEDVTPVEDVTPEDDAAEEKVEDVVILDETENVEAEPVLDDADEAEAAPAPKSRKRAAKNTPTED